MNNFTISEKEIYAFYIKHIDCEILEVHSYVFTPGSIGTAVEIECACGKLVNVTNYSKW